MKQWKQGDPLTTEDERLLEPLVRRARELGRSPKVSEVDSAAQIKARFRLWKNALLAAGLPTMNEPTQVRLRERQAIASKNKENGER